MSASVGWHAMREVRPKHAAGWRRLPRAAAVSLAGLRAAWRNEAAFRQETALAAILVPLAFWLADGSAARALLVGSVLLILVVELLNSAVEAAVDRASPEDHPLAGEAKDLGSAAVFASIVLAAAVWGIVLWR
jgi:diacylglycerol kinase (ATP)